VRWRTEDCAEVCRKTLIFPAIVLALGYWTNVQLRHSSNHTVYARRQRIARH
jgi:hypothetical protein